LAGAAGGQHELRVAPRHIVGADENRGAEDRRLDHRVEPRIVKSATHVRDHGERVEIG